MLSLPDTTRETEVHIAVPVERIDHSCSALDHAVTAMRSGLVADVYAGELELLPHDVRAEIESALLEELAGSEAEYASWFGTARFITYTDPEGATSVTEVPGSRVQNPVVAFNDAGWRGFTAPWRDMFAAAGVKLPVETFKINDMEFVGGDLPESVLNLPLKLGIGRSREDKKWPARAMTFANLLTGLSQHKVGEKNGPAFLQGSAIQNERRAKAMEAMYVVGLDVDSGIHLEWVINRIQNELNLASVIYTTHSHMSDETLVNQSSYAQYARKKHLDQQPTVETMRRYMLEEKSWEQWVVDTVELEDEPVHGVDGIAYILKHAPIPKFRLLFPLIEGYVIAKQRMSQADAINLWKGRLLGLAKVIGIPIDESCLDPSRLFFLNRHKEDRPFRVVCTSGPALDFDSVPVVDHRRRTKSDDNVFAQAGRDLGGNDALRVGAFSAKRWARERAASFDIARLFREVCGEKIRSDDGGDKLEVDCPWDFSHGNAGDPDDRACYVKSAHADHTESGFVWGCQHNSCRQRDRLDFICEALRLEWFNADDLTDDKFRIFTVDDEGQGAFEPGKRVQIDTDEDHSPAAERALAALVASNNKSPRIFHGIDGLVRRKLNKATGLTSLSTVTKATMRYELRRVVSFVVPRDKALRETAVPPQIAEDVLEHDDLDFPVLHGIVTTPFFVRVSERIERVSTPGYHLPSGYLYVPSPGFNVPKVSDEPTVDEIARALGLVLGNVYVDFPFDDGEGTTGEASRCHTLCMLLQPFMRNVIDGPTPAFFVSKPSAGTGAGLLMNATMMIAHGAPGESRTETKDEDERRKGVVAALKSGASYHWLDNLHADLDSAVYASAITSGFMTARVLGTPDEVRLPVRLQWIFSGNNPSASGELVRRFVPIFMDAKGDPLKRKAVDFVHADLEGWVRSNRYELVWACLTLVQAWVAAGAPLDRDKVLPSFEAWSATFGGLLKTIGVPGFLTNLEKLKDNADVELDVFGTLASIWVKRFGIGVRRQIGNPVGSGDWDGDKSLVSVIDECGILIKLGGATDAGRSLSLAKTLKKRKDSVIATVVDGEPCDVILRNGYDASKTSVWWLERAKV